MMLLRHYLLDEGDKNSHIITVIYRAVFHKQSGSVYTNSQVTG